jgi:hypothetical protein
MTLMKRISSLVLLWPTKGLLSTSISAARFFQMGILHKRLLQSVAPIADSQAAIDKLGGELSTTPMRL